MSHFPTCVMHRILVIRTIQGDQNVRRLHRDADLKMAGERRKKKQFHGTGLFHVPTVPSDPRPYKCSLQHPRPKQPTKPISRCPRLPHDRINEKATKNKNPGAEPAARSAPLRPRRRRAGRSHMPRLRIRASSFSSSSRPPTSSSSFGPRKSPYGTPSNLSMWWIL